jgi:DNA-directed RNA polymerase subunit H (RpoH/RPB5)
MISVIVPTMLLCPYDVFTYSIVEMQKNDLVGEIIIINNSNKKILDELKISEDKLVILDQKENIGVNPAWNLGLSIAKHNNYVIINDDVLCSSHIYNKCEYILRESPEIGMVTVTTMHNINNDQYSKIKYTDNIKVSTEIKDGRVGWFMSGRVEEWVIIPKEFKIFYGDDIVYLEVSLNNKKSVILTSDTIGHFTSTTSRTFTKYMYSELPYWREYLRRSTQKMKEQTKK